MVLIGALSWVRGILLVLAQLLGNIIAAAIVHALFPGKVDVNTKLGARTSPTQGVVLEVLLTSQLALTAFVLAVKHTGSSIAPFVIGLFLFLTELAGKYRNL